MTVINKLHTISVYFEIIALSIGKINVELCSSGINHDKFTSSVHPVPISSTREYQNRTRNVQEDEEQLG